MRKSISMASTCAIVGMFASWVALGATGDNKSTETGILKTWSKDGPPLLWQVQVGEGYAAPSIAGGRLYLFDRHGDKVRLSCLDSRSGKEIWRTEYATAYEDMYGFSNGPRAAPVIDGDRVYTFGAEGRLRCHRVKDGSLIWDVDMASTFGVVQNFFGNGSGIVAFDKRTGKVDFRFPFRAKKLESVNARALQSGGRRDHAARVSGVEPAGAVSRSALPQG